MMAVTVVSTSISPYDYRGIMLNYSSFRSGRSMGVGVI